MTSIWAGGEGATSMAISYLSRRLNYLEKAVCQLKIEVTTHQAPEATKATKATDEELAAIWDIPGHSFSEALRAIYNLGREHGSAAAPASEPEPTPDFPPADCAVRLKNEGKSCSSLCAACGDGAPNWMACRRALAQELPAPTGGLLDQVTAAIARANANRFPAEHYRPLAQWAVRAVSRWLANEKWEDKAATALQREVNRG